MAKVGCNVGFKMNLGNFQNADYTLWISDIDTGGDVPAQLAEAVPGLLLTAEWVEQRLREQLEGNELIAAVRERPIPQ